MANGTDYTSLFNSITKTTNIISGTDLIKRELELLFNFQKYTLFFGNNMGLDLAKYLSLTNRTATFNLIKADIEDTLAKYGKVKPVQIDIAFDEDENKILINLIVSLLSGGNQLITVPLSIAN